MIEAGFSEKEVMAITGHKTDRMFRRYHIVRRHRIQAIGEKMEVFYKTAEEAIKSKSAGTLLGTDLSKAGVN
jgi:hypothetical protein